MDWWEARYDRSLGTLALRRLPRPVTPEMGRDETQVAELFAEETEIAASPRDRLAYVEEPHLHARQLSLAAVDNLDEAGLGTNGQTDGIGNECDGRCGV